MPSLTLDHPLVKACAEYLMNHGATEVYVFGSVARGNASERSDLDLAMRGPLNRDYYRVLNELTDITGTHVDLVTLDDGNSFCKHIEEKIEMGWAKRVS